MSAPIGYQLDNSDRIGRLEGNTPDEIRAASLFACQCAHDAADAALLLDITGLRPRAASQDPSARPWPCRKCHAAAGQPCRTGAGRVTSCHKVRQEREGI